MRDYSPADGADHAEECSGAALYRRERQLIVSVVIGVIVVLGFVCDNLRDLRENRPFTCKGRARNEQGKNKE